MTLKSMFPPWKALFFSLSFVFLNESPRVSFSLSWPYLPHSSPPLPYLNLASKELSWSWVLIGPTSSIFILENEEFAYWDLYLDSPCAS